MSATRTAEQALEVRCWSWCHKLLSRAEVSVWYVARLAMVRYPLEEMLFGLENRPGKVRSLGPRRCANSPSIGQAYEPRHVALTDHARVGRWTDD
jgi:hypothetical protein